MRVNISSGLRFNAPQTVRALKNVYDLRIYSSSPVKYWSGMNSNQVSFVPMPYKISSKLFNTLRGRSRKEMDAIIFDWIASKSMRECDIFHGWATFSLLSGKVQKKKGGLFILDRACPHIIFQEKLLLEESNKIGIEYTPVSNRFMDRMLEEYDLADKIVVPSQYTYDSFIENGFNKDKLFLASLDVNFLLSGTKINSTTNKDFIVGSVGGNVLRKGFIYLLEAWERLSIPNSMLLLKTSKNELKKHLPLWDKIKNNPTIEVVGYIENIEEFYMKCDVFCLPSIDEGFGMVVLESMACGTPVIATCNVGSSSFILNGENGYVVPIRDSDSIASKIEFLYKNKSELQLMSENASQYYEDYSLSNDNYKNSIKKMYSSLIS